MRKVSSASNIYETPKILFHYSSGFSRAASGISNCSLFTQRIRKTNHKYSRHLKSNKSKSTRNSSTSFISVVPSLFKEVLYEETLALKQEVNKLSNQISLIKSNTRKKEVDLLLKEKIIGEANLNAISSQDKFDQLIDSNNISKIKKTFAELKVEYQNLMDNNIKARHSIRYLKPNETKRKIEHIKNSLKNCIGQYTLIQLENNKMECELKEALMLSIEFSNQHQMISLLQAEFDKLKEKADVLQKTIDVKKEEMTKNENMKKKLFIAKTSLMKHKQKLINEKKSNEAFLKSKPLFLSKMKEFEEKVKYYKDECKKNETMIKTIQGEATRLENEKRKDNSKLQPVDYHHFRAIEADPIFCSNSKVLLLKSLINESKQKQKKYHLKVQAEIQLLQEFGKPVASIEEINNEMDNITINKQDRMNSKEKQVQEANNKEEEQNEIKGENGQSEVLLKPFLEMNNKIPDSLNSNTTPLQNNNDTKDSSRLQIEQTQQISNELFTEITYVIIKSIEAKRYTSSIAEAKIMNKIKEEKSNPLLNKENYVNQICLNIQDAIGCQNENDIKKIRIWVEFLFYIYHEDIAKVTETFVTLFSNIKEYTEEEDLILTKKLKKALLPYKDKLKDTLINNSNNGIVSYLVLKKFIEEEKVDIKDSYGEFLFYKLKQFNPMNTVSLYDLDLKLLDEVFDNKLNDSKMNVKTENDIEISQEDYVRIITQFAMGLRNYISTNNTTLKQLLSSAMQTIESETNDPGFDVINIEVFVEEMRKIKIEIKTELEIYCLFNRYKISDDSEYLSVDLIENDLGGKNKYEATTRQVMENVPEEEEESNENKVE